MIKHIVLWLFFFLYNIQTFSQDVDGSNTLEKNGIYKHSLLSTHPFSIFFSRLNHNFKTQVSESSELSISLESGNVWGPYIKTYIPNDAAIRAQVSQHAWHQRQYFVDVDSINAETFEITTDGVIKGLRANVNFKINATQEINIGLRTYLLTKGKMPFSIFTSDEFIERFHKKIAGGDDPFDRQVFGLNKAEILYTDRNGRQIHLKNGDFIFGGIEAAYYYYPKFLINKKQNFHINFGGQLGANLSKYNASLDFGITATGVKQFTVFNTKDFAYAASLGVLVKNVVDFQSENIELGTNAFLGSLETAVEYHFVSKGKTIHAFSTNFHFQTRLNSKSEYKYIIPIRPEDGHKAWGHGTTNLYKNNNYWTLVYTFSRKVATSFYLQQDITVNNNPDLQTGVSLRFKI